MKQLVNQFPKECLVPKNQRHQTEVGIQKKGANSC